MMGISCLFAGRVKERYYTDAAAEYIKRLGAYGSVTVTEIREERTSERPSQSEIDAALKKEGAEIISRIPRGAFVVALCVEGRAMSTEEFAATLGGLGQTHSKLCMIIGSSNGLHDDVKRAADLKLSLSRMTLPHSLARVFTLEQLYRAFNVMSGGKYHK